MKFDYVRMTKLSLSASRSKSRIRGPLGLRVSVVLRILTLLLLIGFALPSRIRAQVLAVEHVSVVSMESPELKRDQTVVISQGRIVSVALLAGIRNPTIKVVLDWAGPVDWFELMATEGWSQKEIVADALLIRATPKEEGGQFIERFLAKAIEGKQTLQEVRLKMLASSPLYFAQHLPRSQIYYDVEDEMVPIANCRKLAQRMKKHGRNSQTFEAFFHANAGHDLDEKVASSQSSKSASC